MNPEISSLIRAHIKELKPYSSARDEYKGKQGVFLDANENPFGSVSGGNYNRYPDPYQSKIKQKIASLKGLSEEQIFVGNGSDEIIDLLYRVFCEPKEDLVMVFPPTFGMYDASAGINQVGMLKIPLKSNYQLDIAAIRKQLNPQVKLSFVCSPNNPTGNLIHEADILQLMDIVPGLLVIDEAYMDFAPGKSNLPYLERYPRLVVLQTFSKAWGMANLRLGLAYAHPDIIGVLNKVKLPYNVNGLSQELALKALKQIAVKEKMIADVLEEREFLRAELNKIPLVKKIHPSDANFLLVQLDQADKRYRQLIDKQIVVRNRSKVLLCDDCLRITVGTRTENLQLIQNITAL